MKERGKEASAEQLPPRDWIHFLVYRSSKEFFGEAGRLMFESMFGNYLHVILAI